jgi:hypothetical protein
MGYQGEVIVRNERYFLEKEEVKMLRSYKMVQFQEIGSDLITLSGCG